MLRGRCVRVIKTCQLPHAVAEQWLHAAQAPVRPRHCMHQALLQQQDQLILSTLSRSVSRALLNVRLRSLLSLSLLRASTNLKPAATAASIHQGYRAFRPRNAVREARQRARDVDRHHTTATFLRYHLMGVLGWLLDVIIPFRVPQNHRHVL